MRVCCIKSFLRYVKVCGCNVMKCKEFCWVLFVSQVIKPHQRYRPTFPPVSHTWCWITYLMVVSADVLTG